MNTTKSGFTIVELLIVIVVIGILAAITVVAYNGIQQRAVIASARSDLRNLSTNLELFKAERGTYPEVITSPTYSMDTMASVLKGSGVYTDTRSGAGARKKSFIYCSNSTSTDYIIAAVEPVYREAIIPLNSTLYYTSSRFSGERTRTVDNAGTNGNNICQSISGDASLPIGRWSFDTPLPGAQ